MAFGAVTAVTTCVLPLHSCGYSKTYVQVCSHTVPVSPAQSRPLYSQQPPYTLGLRTLFRTSFGRRALAGVCTHHHISVPLSLREMTVGDVTRKADTVRGKEKKRKALRTHDRPEPTRELLCPRCPISLRSRFLPTVQAGESQALRALGAHWG